MLLASLKTAHYLGLSDQNVPGNEVVSSSAQTHGVKT